MRQKSSQYLYAYWNEIRRGRLAPERLDIEPSRIGEYLADTFVLELGGRRNYRYRLAGSRVCAAFGGELRQTDFLNGWRASDRTLIEQRLSTIAEHGGVLVFAFQIGPDDGSSGIYEAIVLPLVHTGGKIDRFFGAITSITPARARKALEAPLKLTLLHHEAIWPDGKPLPTPGKAPTQDVLLPHVRNARLVKVDQRHFRVYEGGLSKPGPRR